MVIFNDFPKIYSIYMYHFSEISRDLLGIAFLAVDFNPGAQKDITMNFEE